MSSSALMEPVRGPALPKAPTGVSGLDEILNGGLPRSRTTLITGPAGSGKSLLGLEFLVTGAREFGEAGMLITFEESAASVRQNVASLGFDLEGLERDGLLTLLDFRVDPYEVVQSGSFSFEPLFLLIKEAIERTQLRRLVFDTLEALFGAYGDHVTVRAELVRLIRWLDDHDITAIVTAERGDPGLTRFGIEEYVTDCVLVLDHRVQDEISTRRIRVLKYRGSAHGTNEYPFLIGTRGFSVLPITSVSLSYPASAERLPIGVPRLDHMLDGGVFRGSTILVSGEPGSGKSTIGAHVVAAACARGEKALMILFEESPEQVIRNMSSVGIDLRTWVDAGLLQMWAARPMSYSLEAHLAILSQLVEDVDPAVVVLDGVGSLVASGTSVEVSWMLSRQLDLLKARGVTTFVTSVFQHDVDNGAGVSSLVDTWLQLRITEQNGERNRLLYVLKSRGTAHSNQVREFRLTNNGAELVDVYVGSGGVLTGAARLTQIAEEEDERQRLLRERSRRTEELQHGVIETQSRLRALQEQLAVKESELAELRAQESRAQLAESERRQAMAHQRWADIPSAGQGGVDEPDTIG